MDSQPSLDIPASPDPTSAKFRNRLGKIRVFLSDLVDPLPRDSQSLSDLRHTDKILSGHALSLTYSLTWRKVSIILVYCQE